MRALALALLAFPAAADDWCDDLWFARNAIMAEAGHCFASPLGRLHFGADCEGGGVSLSPRQARALETIRGEEAFHGCATDTSFARALSIPHMGLRMRMQDQPARSFESACIGWRGPAFPLRLNARADAQVVVEVPPGSNVGSHHVSGYPGWHFYTVTLPTGLEAAGWADVEAWDEADCDAMAG